MLLEDPGLEMAQKMWGEDGLYEKSAIDLERFKTTYGSISLLYGPRQIGKTSTLKLFLSRCGDADTLIYTDCSTILEKADLLRHLRERIRGRTSLVLDEVQEVEGWQLALRSLHSDGLLKNCRTWCTGSEARYLLESGERLPGRRGEGRNLFARPWNFREHMDFFHPEVVRELKGIDFKHVNQRWLESQKIDLSRAWKEYLMGGGIPRAVAEQRVRGKISDLTWQVYIDWILGSWSKQRTPQRSLSALARRIIETLNTRVSFDALKKGTDIQSANTVKALLETQEDHFALKTIVRFDPQKSKFLPGKLKKIYPIDPFIAQIWAAIGWNVRRLFGESVPSLPSDECAFLAQTFRHTEEGEVSYLYSETTKSEVDFYFQDCAFELKSNGNPTKHQWALLKNCPQWFVVRSEHLPLMAYLIGGARKED